MIALPSKLRIDLGHTMLETRDDGIIQVNGGNHTYSVADIKQIHQAIWELNDAKKALVLLTTKQYTLIDAEAKEYLSLPEVGNFSIAEAYVINTLPQRLILNFLFKVMGTPVPAKFFTNINQAIDWLKTFENKK